MNKDEYDRKREEVRERIKALFHELWGRHYWLKRVDCRPLGNHPLAKRPIYRTIGGVLIARRGQKMTRLCHEHPIDLPIKKDNNLTLERPGGNRGYGDSLASLKGSVCGENGHKPVLRTRPSGLSFNPGEARLFRDCEVLP